MDNMTEKNYLGTLNRLYRLLFNEDAAGSQNDILLAIEDEVKRIQEENMNLNIAIDFSNDNIHLTDGDGNILRVNSAFEERVGSKREDIEGRNVRDLEMEGAYKPSVVKMVMQEKRKLTMIQEGPSGKTITTSTPVFDQDGKLFRVVSNARLVEELTLLNQFLGYHDTADNQGNDSDTKLVFESQVMKTIMKQLNQIKNVDSGILFTGESGTGKSLLARYIHENSYRAEGRFMQINCAAIPEYLMESELFGYETGAFSGANRAGKPGLIELADKGTLFLDEIGDMPINLQSKLLQVIQNRQITRLGGTNPIGLDFRIISATNCNLEELIKQKLFREDLYYRLNVIPIHIPPLRDRSDDIPSLLDWFIKYYNRKYRKDMILSQDVKICLQSYGWPGNIREMENVIERLVVTNETGFITIDDLPITILQCGTARMEPIVIRKIIPLKDAVEEVEKQLVINAYSTFKSSYKVAKSLKISQSAAFRRIKKYIGEEVHG